MGTLSDAVEQCESVSVNEQVRVVQQTTSVGVDLHQQLMMMMTTSSSISRQTRLLRRQRPSPVRCGSHNIHPFNGPLSGTTRVSRYQKGKTIWILLKQETVSGSGISWATCKTAPRSRQITTPAPHHSVFYRPDALPAAQPTASKH